MSAAKQAREVLARQYGISPRLIEYAAVVQKNGIPELYEACRAGTVTVSAGALLAREPHDRQRKIMATVPPRKWRAILTGGANVRRAHCPTCTCDENSAAGSLTTASILERLTSPVPVALTKAAALADQLGVLLVNKDELESLNDDARTDLTVAFAYALELEELVDQLITHLDPR